MKRYGPSRRRAENAPAALRVFVRHPKKTFATISADSGTRGRQIDYGQPGHVSRLDEAKAALPLVFMKCIATHVDFGVNRLSTPANLLLLLQRYIPT